MKKTLIKSLDEYRRHVYRNLQAAADELDPWEGFDSKRIARVAEWVDTSWDRTGDGFICGTEMVELSEFGV